ncbi:hypothetical protein QQP08_007079 [Theobroma cacao]|nr:hypothetical protein QQP08_007079 [Theobroma cacao]
MSSAFGRFASLAPLPHSIPPGTTWPLQPLSKVVPPRISNQRVPPPAFLPPREASFLATVQFTMPKLSLH